jgi:hypothetical protein
MSNVTVGSCAVKIINAVLVAVLLVVAILIVPLYVRSDENLRGGIIHVKCSSLCDKGGEARDACNNSDAEDVVVDVEENPRVVGSGGSYLYKC